MRQVFVEKPKGSSQDRLEKILIYKTWAMHSLFTLFKVFGATSGSAPWLDMPKPPCQDWELENDQRTALEAEEAGLCLPLNYNYELMRKIYPLLKEAGKVLVFVSVLLDFLIIKWRNLAHLCIVVELMFFIPYNFIVSDTKSYSDINIMQSHLVGYLALYSNRGWQIVLITCMMLLNCYFLLDSVLERD